MKVYEPISTNLGQDVDEPVLLPKSYVLVRNLPSPEDRDRKEESILLTGVHTCIWAGTSNSQETGATDPYVDEIPSCHYCASKKNSKKYPQETKADSHGHQPAPDPWCNISRKNSTNSDTFVDKTDLKTSKINHLNHRSLHNRNVAICIVMAIVMVILLLFVAHAKLGKN